MAMRSNFLPQSLALSMWVAVLNAQTASLASLALCLLDEGHEETNLEPVRLLVWFWLRSIES